MISSLSKRNEMGVNRLLLSKHWESLWMGGNHTDQIYSRGKWSCNSEAKKKEGKEGKYKLKWLVNIIMCASCNHPFKRRYRRGVLTDGCPRGQRRRSWMGLKLQLLCLSFSRHVTVAVFLVPLLFLFADSMRTHVWAAPMFWQCDWLIQ